MCDLTFAPSTPAPSPENSYHGHYSLVCVRVSMSVMLILGAMCLGRGQMSSTHYV